MNEFSRWYVALLRKQVEEEIEFLRKNGHDHDRIYMPCIFCVEMSQKYYTCNRLKELNRFMASIQSHESSQFTTRQLRRQIGYEVQPTQQDIIPAKFDLGVKQLPLLSIKL